MNNWISERLIQSICLSAFLSLCLSKSNELSTAFKVRELNTSNQNFVCEFRSLDMVQILFHGHFTIRFQRLFSARRRAVHGRNEPDKGSYHQTTSYDATGPIL